MKALCALMFRLFDSRPALLTNSFFNTPQLKQRIQMLVNPQTSRQQLWRYVLIVPIGIVLLMCSQKDPVSTPLPIGSRAAAKDKADTKLSDNDEVFSVVEESPKPQGGIGNLMTYLSQHLRYPAAAQRAQVEGKVFVSFVVTTEGKIKDVQILKGLGFGCDEEAVRVVLQMPPWIPGRQNGRAVNVKFNLPIAFTLH